MTSKLHDDILSALPFDFTRRMANWARSLDGAPVSGSTLEERVDHTRTEHPIPLLLGEATDTHAAILRLPQRYQEIITTFWMFQSKPLSWMATATPRLRLWKYGPASFREKLEIGHEMLMTEFGAKRRRSA